MISNTFCNTASPDIIWIFVNVSWAVYLFVPEHSDHLWPSSLIENWLSKGAQDLWRHGRELLKRCRNSGRSVVHCFTMRRKIKRCLGAAGSIVCCSEEGSCVQYVFTFSCAFTILQWCSEAYPVLPGAHCSVLLRHIDNRPWPTCDVSWSWIILNHPKTSWIILNHPELPVRQVQPSDQITPNLVFHHDLLHLSWRFGHPNPSLQQVVQQPKNLQSFSNTKVMFDVICKIHAQVTAGQWCRTKVNILYKYML